MFSLRTKLAQALRAGDAGSGDIAGVVEFQVKTGAAGRNEYNPGRGTRKTDVSVRFYSRAGNRRTADTDVSRKISVFPVVGRIAQVIRIAGVG